MKKEDGGETSASAEGQRVQGAKGMRSEGMAFTE